MALLHITNGDSAGDILKSLFPHDTVLPWRDVLHDGPVPPELAFEEFSRVRAAFLASCGFAPLEDTLAEFHARDTLIARHAEFGEVVLWFEHDLYDQLQLIQILDWFAGRGATLSLIQATDYLGGMKPACLAGLFPARNWVTDAQCRLASAAWHAFRSPDPRGLEQFLEPNPALPFLAPAILRFCEEYPWLEDGLTRTERTILRLRAEGISEPHELFRAFSESEEPRWMGDASFFRILRDARDREGPWRWDAHAWKFVRAD